MEKHERVINGIKYVVEEMDGIQALVAEVRLLKIVGPAISELKKEKLTKENISNVKKKLLGALLNLIGGDFDDELVIKFIPSLFDKYVFYEHEGQLVKVNMDIHFRGKVKDMWQVAAFILETNFGDSLGK